MMPLSMDVDVPLMKLEIKQHIEITVPCGDMKSR